MKIKYRCLWVPEGNEVYQKYHDEEWGRPVHDDRKHFEFLILEGAQAGLSWLTILKRREGYRKAFAEFEVEKVAKFDNQQIEKLIMNASIIRNRLKIKSAVENAKRFIEVQKEFGSFDKYIWGFVNNQPIKHMINNINEYLITIPEAEALSRDLKKRGFSFVGPTVMYAHMQACGLVNDHMTGCFKFKSRKTVYSKKS